MGNTDSSPIRDPDMTTSSTLDRVTAQQLHDMRLGPDGARVAVIDVRDADRAEGWIPGSMHMPTSQLRAGSAQANAAFMDAFVDRMLAESFAVLVFHCMFSQVRGPYAAGRALEAIGRNARAAGRLRVCILHDGFVEYRRQFPQMIES